MSHCNCGFLPDSNLVKELDYGDVLTTQDHVQLILQLHDPLLVLRDLALHQLENVAGVGVQGHGQVVCQVVRDAFICKAPKLSLTKLNLPGTQQAPLGSVWRKTLE